MSITKATFRELYLRAYVREVDRLLAIPSVPPVTGNAKVIAKWPAKDNSSLTGISYQQKAPARLVW